MNVNIRRRLFPSFRRLSILNHRLGQRLTGAGKLLLIGLFTSAILGFDTQRGMIYQLFALFSVLLAQSLLFVWLFRGRFAVRRQLPPFATVGVPFNYPIHLHNLGKTTHKDLRLHEEMADPYPSFQTFEVMQEPGEQRRGLFDRNMRYYRFAWLVARNLGIRCQEGVVDHLPAATKQPLAMQGLPLRRGLVHFAGVNITRSDPLGLLRGRCYVKHPQTLLVLPKRYPLSPSLQVTGRWQQPSGIQASVAAQGASEEFVALREYQNGDSTRHLHWPSLAKQGPPLLKLFRGEHLSRHALILDTFFAGQEDVFEAAVSVAASFAVTEISTEARLDLLFVHPEIFSFAESHGVAHAQQLLEVLARVTAEREKPFFNLSSLVISQTSAINAAVLVLLSWDSARQRLVRRLMALGIPMRILLIVPAGTEHDFSTEPLGDYPQWLRILEVGRIAEGLAQS